MDITRIRSNFNKSSNTTTLTIMWMPATNQYCKVLHYNILLYSNEHSSTRNEPGLSTSTVFTDVENYALYNITVTAFNEVGNLSASKFDVEVRVSFDTRQGL